MTTEQLYDMKGQGNFGYACVFKREDHGKHTDFLFPMTPENIANFIGQNAFTADKIIMTDFCEPFLLGNLLEHPVMPDSVEQLGNQLKHLTPNQIEMVSGILSIMIDHIGKE